MSECKQDSVLIDRFGRQHSYLRISVTDRCNLRCSYCMPAEGITLKKKEELLSFEEIHRIARLLVKLGISKIRITGGEPLVRKELECLIAQISSIDGLKHLSMTTNGVLLASKAAILKKAGLKSLNISIDTLRPERFKEITRRDNFAELMSGIEKAQSCGFNPLKLNVVLIKGTNDDEILDFVHFVKDKEMNLRFIEYMPFKDNNWDANGVFSYAQIKAEIEKEFALEPIKTDRSDVAKDFQIEGYKGKVSFISSMSDSFCASCNRLRMTADGSIKSCLFYDAEVNLRDALRKGSSDEDLKEMILYALQSKPEAHPPMEELATLSNRAMVEIGG